ncbi:MAG: GH32 C-terminal domain-containing protein [Segetibacter sp.]
MFTPESGKHPNNYGNCFYASQTFNNIPKKDGRRIQMARGRVNTPGMSFNQCMLFPVKLTLKTTDEGIRMFSEPVKEIALLHKKGWKRVNMVIEPGDNPISGINGELYHIIGTFKVENNAQFGFKIHGTEILFNAVKGELTCMDKKAELMPERGKVSFEIIADRNTIEIFGNHGQVYMPIARDLTRNYGSEFICRNGKVTAENLQIFELKSIWK